jgi:hypothetical protein
MVNFGTKVINTNIKQKRSQGKVLEDENFPKM